MIAGLGPRILRTETASLAAVAVIQGRFGDLVGEDDRVSKERHG
jgi:hypothetical protein